MTNLVPYNDLERMGATIAKSKLFGMKTPEEAVALMLIAQAEGKHPATAAQEYNVIQGRPALKADAMLARFQANNGKVKWLVYTDKEVSGEFSHPSGGSVTITWNMEMATKLGYHTKDNWKKFPRAMMRARCISEGVRTVYPGIAVGIYTPEEVQDFDDKPMVDVTPQRPTSGDLTAKQAYGSARAMKDRFVAIRDKINETKDSEELDAVFAEYRADFNNMKAIDEEIYNNLITIGTNRRKAFDEDVEGVPPYIKEMDEQFKNAVG